jgi:WS/DGAT/MGAT family acyltransferase
MRKLSALDLAFFIAESKGSPKSVAGLMVCKKPVRAPANFCRKLVEDLKSHDRPCEPFNLVIRFLGLKGPHWRPCEEFDIDEHVFYHKPRNRISWQEVLKFVSRLHEPVMDRSRPLWEYHLIDGIEGGRFAVYTKIHHAYADGVTMSRWVSESLATSADDLEIRPPWAAKRRRKKTAPASPSIAGAIRNLSDQTWNQVLTTGGIAKLATQQYLEKIGITHHAVSVPFGVSDDSPLTGDATAGRSIATTWMTMKDVKRVCKATRSTLNHVALSCIDGGLHRYLDEIGHGIDHPITIQMPINLRKGGGDKAGNSVGVALVELSEPTDDALLRLGEIGHSLRRVKDQINSVPGDSIEQYTVLLALTGELIDKLQLTNRIPSNGHTLVSNLPGPKEQLYLMGARVEQYYPLSILVPGLRMNITLFSVGGILNYGIVATKDLPELNLLAEYISEEFNRLQKSVLGSQEVLAVN